MTRFFTLNESSRSVNDDYKDTVCIYTSQRQG